MKSPLRQSLFFLVLSALPCLVNSDVAPTTYFGQSLSPYDIGTVQMKSENVDIYFGKLCKVVATFELLNPQPRALDLKIGFPVNISYLKQSGKEPLDSINRIYNFRFELNGKIVPETDVPEPVIRSDRGDWYGWHCVLKPKNNLIKLTYFVKTNPSYDYYWVRNLYYVLYTGKFWAGKIRSAEIRVHFPDGIDKAQVLQETSPPGYHISRNTIGWKFREFEPTQQSNIHLQLIDFQTFSELNRHRATLRDTNISAGAKLKAALFYARLAPAKGINLSVPPGFEASYFTTIILPNATQPEHDILKSRYELVRDSSRGDYFCIKDYDGYWKDENGLASLEDLLRRTRYFEEVKYPEVIQFVKDARRLFQEVVAAEPRNSAAWIAYIENFYRLETKGCNPCVGGNGRLECSADQKRVIREAYSNCGEDQRIKLWYDFINPDSTAFPDTLGQITDSSEEEIRLDMKEPEHGRVVVPIRLDEFETLKKRYTISMGNYLVINGKSADDTTSAKISNFLFRNHYFLYKFCRDLNRLESTTTKD